MVLEENFLVRDDDDGVFRHVEETKAMSDYYPNGHRFEVNDRYMEQEHLD